jgi:hypothetical protein
MPEWIFISMAKCHLERSTMDYTIVDKFPRPLLMKMEGPCFSLYMPTHRTPINLAKDILVYKQLLKEAQISFDKLPQTEALKALIKDLNNLIDDLPFWQYNHDGLAIFATIDEMIIYRIDSTVKPFVVIADSFHIKPLYAYFQNEETFYFIALEAERFALYEGNTHHISLVPFPPESKVTLQEVLGSQLTDNYQTNGVYGGSFVGSTFHGHGGKKDAIAIDREKYFRYVDRFIYDNFSKHHPIPVILVALKEHHFIFRSVAKNPHIITEMIDGSFEVIQSTHFKKDLKIIAEKRFISHLHRVIHQYQDGYHHQHSSDDLTTIAKALMDGRVASLMIETDRVIPGQVNHQLQTISLWDLREPHTDDILDDLLQLAMNRGTKVYMIDKKLMPTTQGVAASFRF